MSAGAVAEKPVGGASGTRRSTRRSPGGATLGQEVGRDTRREAGRQQALARAAQRAVGLSPPAPAKATGKKIRRRRVARALSVAATLRREDAAVIPSAGDGKETAR